MASQTAPPWPPTPPAAPTEQLPGASICEPYRDYLEAQLRLKRNAMAIYQDLVDQFGFTGACWVRPVTVNPACSLQRCSMLDFEGKSYRLREAAARIAAPAPTDS